MTEIGKRPPELTSNRAVEDAAIAWVMDLERAAGREPRDTRYRGAPGDIESTPRIIEVKAAGPQAAARSLSGGNLQKFIVGREIDARPRLLVLAQPTWGVDVGAAALIRAELLALRDAGCALLVVSEELDELFEIADRLLVMAGGRVSPGVPVREASVETIGQWMSGLWPAEGAHAAARA